MIFYIFLQLHVLKTFQVFIIYFPNDQSFSIKKIMLKK